MTLQMKSQDHFWWTFFHEAAHLLLHRGRNFLDQEQEGESADRFEQEADRWAEKILVGRARLDQFAMRRPRSEAAIRRFASETGIHPCIIVGMLQHRGVLPHRNLNRLKMRFAWSE